MKLAILGWEGTRWGVNYEAILWAFILSSRGRLVILLQRTSTGVDGVKIFAMVLIAAALLIDNFSNLYKQLIERVRK